MTKTKKTILFNHLGFPVKLVNCPHIEVDGELVPDVDYAKLEDFMFQILPLKPTRLSGAEIKFIRHHLELTQEQFADWLADKVEASTVSRWEKEDLEATDMSDSMERSLRMQLIGMILESQRRKTVPLNDVMKLLSLSISTNTSEPLVLKMPIPTKLPRELMLA